MSVARGGGLTKWPTIVGVRVGRCGVLLITAVTQPGLVTAASAGRLIVLAADGSAEQPGRVNAAQWAVG